MEENARAMVLASFMADSLSLAAHWIYDTDRIESELGRIDDLRPPPADGYHANRQRGDFTHYGDQALLLLEYLAENNGFALETFADRWQQFAEGYDGYVDNATRKTLAAFQEGKSPQLAGSGSSDLGGVARLAPLIYWYHHQPDELVKFAHEATQLTHTGSGIDAGTDFLVKTILAVLDGQTPTAAIEETLDTINFDLDLDMRMQRAVESGEQESRAAIGGFGQMCAISAALPGAVHLILAHEDNLQEALIANVMAGGDSAARGMFVGMVLGAHLGPASLNKEWISAMRVTPRIEACLDKRR